MKRLLILLALTGFSTAAACGDDDGDDKTPAPKPADDAGNPPTPATMDTGVPGPRPEQVTNPGAACTPQSTTDCMGPGAKCETEIMVGMGVQSTALPGGYCSAQCAAPSECGAGGGCPSAEISALLTGFADLAAGYLPSYCLDKCDARASDCRTGYSCKSLGELVPPELAAGPGAILLALPALRTTYCLPPVSLPDAGVARAPASIPARVTGLDAGVDGGF